jgi:hypothetical protein
MATLEAAGIEFLFGAGPDGRGEGVRFANTFSHTKLM